MDEFEIQQRQIAFNSWLRTYGPRIGYYKLPPSMQNHVHHMLRKAFNGGYNLHKRESEPVQIGGDW